MSFKDYLRIFNNAWKSAMFGGEDFSLTEKAHKEIEEYFNKIDEDSNLSKFSANFCYVLGSFAGMVNSFYVLAWFGVYKTDSERKIKEREEFEKELKKEGEEYFQRIKKIRQPIFRNDNLEKKVRNLLDKFPDDYIS